MSPIRTAVIIDMSFNIGNIKNDKWPNLYKAIKNLEWTTAAKEIMNSEYSKQVGNRAKRNACIMKDDKMYTKEK